MKDFIFSRFIFGDPNLLSIERTPNNRERVRLPISGRETTVNLRFECQEMNKSFTGIRLEIEMVERTFA